jgi:hypothetical protein
VRNSTRVFLAWSFLASFLTVPLAAESITYTMTGTLTGTLDGTPFFDKAFTFVFDANTADITSPDPGVLFDEASSTSTSIAGFSAGDFTQGIAVAAVPSLGRVGFADPSNTDESLVIENSGFDGWNLATTVGPFEESGAALGSTGDFSTSLGTLVFFGGAENVSFSATVAAVPEPATIGLIALSLFGIALRRRMLRG